MSSSPRRALDSPGSVRAFVYPEPGAAARVLPEVVQVGPAADLEVDRLLAEARALGFSEGLKQAQEKPSAPASQPMAEIAQALQKFQVEKADYYSRVEVELVHLALSIAARILHREAQVDRMLVGSLVKVALEKIQQGTKIAVRVNPEEIVVWTEYLEKNLAGRLNFSVIGDDSVKLRHCVLETELGQTEIGIESQLKEIERGFFDLLAQRPEAK